MSVTLEDLCQLMHDTYETAAVKHGWHTNERSRVSWSAVPVENKATMRDAVAVVVDAVREDERAQHGPEALQTDLRQIMEALHINTYARSYSPHDVVQKEILPRIRKMAQYSPEAIQADLSLILSELNINVSELSSPHAPHDLIKHEVLPKLRNLVARLDNQEKLCLQMKKALIDVKASVGKSYDEVKGILDAVRN